MAGQMITCLAARPNVHLLIVEKKLESLVIGGLLLVFANHFDILDNFVAHGCNQAVYVAQL
jgi:hypothetical protein